MYFHVFQEPEIYAVLLIADIIQGHKTQVPLFPCPAVLQPVITQTGSLYNKRPVK